MGILFALLVCAVIVVAMITFDWILNILDELKAENDTTVVMGPVSGVMVDPMPNLNDDLISLEELKKKLEARAGKKGIYTARIENGVVLKDSVMLYKSDKMDQKTEDLMRENNGMLIVA